MKVLVNTEASRNYIRRCYQKARPSCGKIHNSQWAEQLKSIEGIWLEVDTKFLFVDQFNVRNNNNELLGLMLSDISEIKDDVRKISIKCNWCGNLMNVSHDKSCTNCKKSEYLEKWIPKFPKK